MHMDVHMCRIPSMCRKPHIVHQTPITTHRLLTNTHPHDPPPPQQKYSALAAQGAAQVFATDTVLTALMTTPRTVYPWDLLIVKKNNQVFLDIRPGSTLGQLSVNETAPDAASDDKDAINGMQQLMNEATAVNRSFSQQVLLFEGETHECGEPHPFSATGGPGGAPGGQQEALAGTAFRYRKWHLSDTLDIVVRCEVDGVTSIKGQDQLLLIKTLNEYDSRVSGLDWRQKLDTQRGAVLATELKNNAAKVRLSVCHGTRGVCSGTRGVCSRTRGVCTIIDKHHGHECIVVAVCACHTMVSCDTHSTM